MQNVLLVVSKQVSSILGAVPDNEYLTRMEGVECLTRRQ